MTTEQKSQVQPAADNPQEIPGSQDPTTASDGAENRSQTALVCFTKAAIPYSTPWVNRKGFAVDEIKVYFYNEPLEYTELSHEQLTNDKIIELVNENWNEECIKQDAEKGRYVPRFRKIGEKEKADVRIKYAKSGDSYSTVGVEAQNNASIKGGPTTFLAINGFPEHIIQHTILHEFGHILGLQHEHQHPEYLEVMKEFLDEWKCYNLWLKRLPISVDAKDKSMPVFQKNNWNPQCTMEGFSYDQESIMHYPTSLDMLKDEYASKIRNEKDLDKLKESGKINERQHLILRGFLFHLNNHVTCVPSEGDIRMISEAYFSKRKSTSRVQTDSAPQNDVRVETDSARISNTENVTMATSREGVGAATATLSSEARTEPSLEARLASIDDSTILETRHISKVNKVFKPMLPAQARELGLGLGLHLPRLAKMSNETLHMDMAQAWVSGHDDSRKVCGGRPTWRALARVCAELEEWGAVEHIEKHFSIPGASVRHTSIH